MSNSNHPTYANGKICYLEIPSGNVNESSSFYHKVFGWNIRTREMVRLHLMMALVKLAAPGEQTENLIQKLDC